MTKHGNRLPNDIRPKIISVWQASELAKKNPALYGTESILSWKELAERFLVSKEAARSVVRTFQKSGRIEANFSPGRPRKTTPRDDRSIVLASERTTPNSGGTTVR